MIYLFIFIILIFILKKNNIKEKFTKKHIHNIDNNINNDKDICRGFLTDKEYLEHMIPHHQVAIDISIIWQKKTNSPKVLEFIRDLIWIQKYEIYLMEYMLEKMPNNVSEAKKNKFNYYIPTQSDYYKPNKVGLTQTYCDPNFFDPHTHMKQIKNMKMSDDMYIEHMMPHHQVAVDMSKVLLKNTKSDFMIYLAYRIIRSQQEEILILQDYLNSEYKYKSLLINT